MVFRMEDKKETTNAPENSAAQNQHAGRFEEVLMREAHELCAE